MYIHENKTYKQYCFNKIFLIKNSIIKLFISTTKKAVCTCKLLLKRSGRRGSNSRPPPWQGGVLPLNYFRAYMKVKMRVKGLEPPRHKTLDPKSSASANSATPACELKDNSKMAGAVGIEPTLTVLETVVLPLNYAPRNDFFKRTSLINDAIS